MNNGKTSVLLSLALFKVKRHHGLHANFLMRKMK